MVKGVQTSQHWCAPASSVARLSSAGPCSPAAVPSEQQPPGPPPPPPFGSPAQPALNQQDDACRVTRLPRCWAGTCGHLIAKQAGGAVPALHCIEVGQPTARPPADPTAAGSGKRTSARTSAVRPGPSCTSFAYRPASSPFCQRRKSCFFLPPWRGRRGIPLL